MSPARKRQKKDHSQIDQATPHVETNTIGDVRDVEALKEQPRSDVENRNMASEDSNEVEKGNSVAEGLEEDANPRSPKRQRIASAEPEGASAKDPSIQLPTASSTTEQSSTTAAGASFVAKVAGTNDALASTQAKLDSLPVLSNLSSQLLSVLARMPPAEALQLLHNQTTPLAREYHMIRSLFNPVRQLYLTGLPFLCSTPLGLIEPSQVDILRKANQSMYMSSIFTGEIGLRDMDQNFLDIFVPEQGKLLKAQGSIYLELKTQAFITAMRTRAAEPYVVMADLFPSDIEQKILQRRPGTNTLAPSEQDFINRFNSRRDILQKDIDQKALDSLHLRYRWEDFSREVSSYLAKTYGVQPGSKPSGLELAQNASPGPRPQDQMQGKFSIHEPATPSAPASSSISQQGQPFQPGAAVEDSGVDDFVAQAARAAEIAMQESMGSEIPHPLVEHATPATGPTPEGIQQPKVKPEFQIYTPTSQDGNSRKASPSPHTDNDIPHASQSAPTHVLYERARLVATSKSPSAKKELSAPISRRPWTQEEEGALMNGLDQVKGPHWSQILAMYGPGGSINETLKDRNQVQLKDKARNLKLFFLKSGVEVPYYLSSVTGDLKTRAPGQAERQEREKVTHEEDKAHYDGREDLMVVADGSNEQTPKSGQYEDAAVTQVGKAEATGPGAGPDLAEVEAMIARAAAEASSGIE